MEINPNNINVKLIIMASFLFIFAQYDTMIILMVKNLRI